MMSHESYEKLSPYDFDYFNRASKQALRSVLLTQSYIKWGKEIKVINFHGHYYMVCLYSIKKKKLLTMSPSIDSKIEALYYAQRMKKWLILEPYKTQILICG